jgi:hypothetical protein
LTNDFFVRTTAAQHKAAVVALWRRLEANGQIYLASYEGWYGRPHATFQRFSFAVAFSLCFASSLYLSVHRGLSLFLPLSLWRSCARSLCSFKKKSLSWSHLRPSAVRF